MAYGFDETKNKVEVPSLESFRTEFDTMCFDFPNRLRMMFMQEIFTLKKDLAPGESVTCVEYGANFNDINNVRALVTPTTTYDACPLCAEVNNGLFEDKNRIIVRFTNLGKQTLNEGSEISYNILMMGEY